MVSTVAAILRQGEPTVFAFEAACRHGLRIRLIFEGWRWADADSTAAEIVATALRRVGAQRPTWYQGQPEYTQEGYAPSARTLCARCGGPMLTVEARNGWQQRYCSILCRHGAELRNEAMSRAEYWQALRAAGEVKRLERQRDCERCGTPFIPQAQVANPRFCSKACFHASIAVQPRPCGWCRNVFTPRKRHIKFCSYTCAARNREAMRASAFACQAVLPLKRTTI